MQLSMRSSFSGALSVCQSLTHSVTKEFYISIEIFLSMNEININPKFMELIEHSIHNIRLFYNLRHPSGQ